MSLFVNDSQVTAGLGGGGGGWGGVHFFRLQGGSELRSQAETLQFKLETPMCRVGLLGRFRVSGPSRR